VNIVSLEFESNKGNTRTGECPRHVSWDLFHRWVRPETAYNCHLENRRGRRFGRPPEARAAQRRFGDYFDEFSGKKRRRRVKEIEYISRHGDIVRALRKWRQRTLGADEKLAKDAYVDLGVQSRDALRELYEVKSSCERQALYTAVRLSVSPRFTAALNSIVRSTKRAISEAVSFASIRATIIPRRTSLSALATGISLESDHARNAFWPTPFRPPPIPRRALDTQYRFGYPSRRSLRRVCCSKRSVR
jgi:hypothetical protein